MKRFMIPGLIGIALILGGCGQEADTKPVYTQSPVSVIEKPSGQGGNRNTTPTVWDDYAEKWGEQVYDQGIPPEPDLGSLYLEGLKHGAANVRWYAANRAFEFVSPANQDKYLNELKKLMADKDESVKKAAAFSYEIINHTFAGPEFVSSDNQEKIVFHAFHGARFNDGRLWVYSRERNDIGLLKTYGGSIIDMKWSPDSQKLCVTYGGRLFSDVAITDTEKISTKESGLFIHINKHKVKYAYQVGQNQRPDPMVSFMEWSPDSKKVLLFYSFFDDNLISQKGVAVLNIESGSFERVIPMGESERDYPPAEKPADFTW